MKKILLRIGLVVVVLVVVAGLALTLFLDSVVKKGVETIGPKLTKVSVKLDGVSLSLLSGSGQVTGLEVGNPAGYKAPTAIKLGSASLALSTGSVFSDKLVIKHIRVESAEITIEGSPKNNNLTKILENVQASSGSSNNNTNEVVEQEGSSKRLQVDEFVLTGTKVTYVIAGQSIPIQVPDIKLMGLGEGPEGITPGDLTTAVLSKLTADLAPLLAEQAGKIGKQAVDTATDSLDKAAKGITDLFKKN
jgi:uncharacterized protein involved in outer membrane biogenesis